MRASSLRYQEDAIEVEVADDGRGPSSTGYGRRAATV